MNYAEFICALEENPRIKTKFLFYLRFFNQGAPGFKFCRPKMINGEFDYSRVIEDLRESIKDEDETFELAMQAYQKRVQVDRKSIRKVIDFALPLPIREEIPPPWRLAERQESV